jgi:hypothetical protein
MDLKQTWRNVCHVLKDISYFPFFLMLHKPFVQGMCMFGSKVNRTGFMKREIWGIFMFKVVGIGAFEF